MVRWFKSEEERRAFLKQEITELKVEPIKKEEKEVKPKKASPKKKAKASPKKKNGKASK